MKSSTPLDPLLALAVDIRLDQQTLQALALLLPTLSEEQRDGLKTLLKSYQEAEEESAANFEESLHIIQEEYVKKLAALRREQLIQMVRAKQTTTV